MTAAINRPHMLTVNNPRRSDLDIAVGVGLRTASDRQSSRALKTAEFYACPYRKLNLTSS